MSDITAETIGKILDIAKPEIHEVTDALGRQARFSTKPLHEVKTAPPPMAEMVEVNTLTGFADLVRAGLEALSRDACLIHIEDHHTVTLVSKGSDQFGRRGTLIKAQPVDFERFRFGVWYDQEAFAIAIASMFADTEDKDYVLKTASALVNEAIRSHEDNGFVQKVTVKAGIRTKDEVTLKPRVALAPFRTFPEVDQPVSSFVFRARCAENTAPALMLVEADGGRWKVDAIAILKRAMTAFDLGIPIIA